jgi:dephospho-CoA kinase
LTGGIASGKTAVSNEFAALGVDIFDTDRISRDVVAPGSPTLDKIVAAFGRDVLDSTGHMDRKRMRERVFADPTLRRQLNDITHPAIREELARRSALARGPYQIHVIPLLVEGGRDRSHDRVLVVDCPEELQLARLIHRDGGTETQARQILAAQASREQRVAAADDVLTNTGSVDELRTKVRALHAHYLKLAHPS